MVHGNMLVIFSEIKLFYNIVKASRGSNIKVYILKRLFEAAPFLDLGPIVS